MSDLVIKETCIERINSNLKAAIWVLEDVLGDEPACYNCKSVNTTFGKVVKGTKEFGLICMECKSIFLLVDIVFISGIKSNNKISWKESVKILAKKGRETIEHYTPQELEQIRNLNGRRIAHAVKSEPEKYSADVHKKVDEFLLSVVS